MEGTAVAVCEILKYLIIHWKCETAGGSEGASLEGQLVIAIEALNSKHQANTLHCVTTIASAGNGFGGLVCKKSLKEIQSILLGFSIKLNWTSKEASCSQDVSGVTPFQMIFEVDEKPKSLRTDSLVIKNFLRKIVMVHPKIRFNFSVKVNGILSTEIFEAENEPTLNMSNGIALVVNSGHYVSIIGFHPVDGETDSGAEGSVQIQIYLGSFFVSDLVLPDVSYHVEFSEGDQSQHVDPQGQTLLLILFVDFHSEFPVQQMELWGLHTWLTTHLSAILRESHDVVQASMQVTVDQALEQYHQAAKAHQKLQAPLSVAVSSILSVVTGSTSSSFRNTCLQAFQAADTRELGTKLHKSFHEITQHRFLHHCSCEVKQLLPEKNDAESTQDAHENSSLELLAGVGGQVLNKITKSSLRQVGGEAQAFHFAGARSTSEDALPSTKPPDAASTPGGSRASLGKSEEDALWLQEVSNLSEWLSPDP